MYLSGRLYQLSTTIDNVFSSVIRDYFELEKMNASYSNRLKFISNTEQNIRTKIRDISLNRIKDITSSDEYKVRPDDIRNAISFCAISGKANVMRGIPYSATSMSFYNEDGNQTESVVFDVYRNTYYYAETGKNSFTSKQKLRVSSNTDIETAYIACDNNSYKLLSKYNCHMRITGSVLLDLAFMSGGKYDAVTYKNIEFNEFEACLLMVRGSGGFIKYFQQEDKKYTVLAASSIKLISQLEKLFFTQV